MVNKKKVMRIVLVILSLVLFLTACGKKDAEKDTEKDTDDTEQTDQGVIEDDPDEDDKVIEEPGDPQQGGSVIVGITQELDSLDPYLAAAAGTKEVIYNFFDGLVKLMPDGTFEPALAESFDFSDDATEFTFKIRTGVKFHNGDDLTLDDVVYSLERAAGMLPDSEAALIPQLAIIESVSADTEAGTVTVKLKESDADFITYMTLAIIPQDYTEQAQKPIGTGPFIFTEYKTQTHLKMKRNPDYWRDRTAYLDEVTFMIVPDADAAIMDLQEGNFDIFPYLTIDKAELLKDKYDFIAADSNMVQIWGLNNQRAPFDDPVVRKAINMAIDKQMLIDAVTFGEGRVLESGMAPPMQDYYNADLTSPYNPEEAKSMLEEAGYQDLKIEITVPGDYVIHVQTAEVLAEQLKQIGVTAEVKTVDWGTWLSDVYMGRNYDSTVIALTFDYVAPATVLRHYYSKSDNNFINFVSTEFDELYEAALSETDHAKRVELYHQMQKILQDDAASVFLQNPGTQTAVIKTLGGYTTYPQYVQDMYTVYFK
ncbi:MAG: ABC transporter substrate-binding protein [Clostridiaceae bacterium]|nr:ABC transporter substrate-binding protein [Clostridiaceae bacterium]